MAATHKTRSSSPRKSSKSKTSRCWAGFEPVPGKAAHEQGSCRRKSAPKNKTK